MATIDLGGGNTTPKSMLDLATGVICECGNDQFEQSFYLLEVSNPNNIGGPKGINPVGIFTCKKCGKLAQPLLDNPQFMAILGLIKEAHNKQEEYVKFEEKPLDDKEIKFDTKNKLNS